VSRFVKSTQTGIVYGVLRVFIRKYRKCYDRLTQSHAIGHGRSERQPMSAAALESRRSVEPPRTTDAENDAESNAQSVGGEHPKGYIRLSNRH
jgi:hypothetical protein